MPNSIETVQDTRVKIGDLITIKEEKLSFVDFTNLVFVVIEIANGYYKAQLQEVFEACSKEKKFTPDQTVLLSREDFEIRESPITEQDIEGFILILTHWINSSNLKLNLLSSFQLKK